MCEETGKPLTPPACVPCLVFHHCMDICASISSIFLRVVARSSGLEGIELWKKDGRRPGSVPASTSLRRILRSMSNSRLRTKSLRRLRSIISLSICLEYELSRSVSPSPSAKPLPGLRTNRTTRDNKPPGADSSLFAIGVRGTAGQEAGKGSVPEHLLFQLAALLRL